MKTPCNSGTILVLSLPLAILFAISSFCGLFYPAIYEHETIYWATQGAGQDAINLFAVTPLFFLVSLLAWKGNLRALYLWSGFLFYITYSYVIYAFALHFNALFLVYCSILGLSFYSLLYFWYNVMHSTGASLRTDRLPVRSTSVFLLICALLFYLLWLREIIPALARGNLPQSIVDTGLLVNPVHVLDLSVCLPGLIITAVLLLRRRHLGLAASPAMLVFCVLMALAICSMTIAMIMKGLEVDIVVFLTLFALAIISSVFLFRYLKRIKSFEP